MMCAQISKFRQNRSEGGAATKIQSRYRGRGTRKKKEAKEQTVASTKIQANYRGRKSRRKGKKAKALAEAAAAPKYISEVKALDEQLPPKAFFGSKEAEAIASAEPASAVGPEAAPAQEVAPEAVATDDGAEELGGAPVEREPDNEEEEQYAAAAAALEAQYEAEMTGATLTGRHIMTESLPPDVYGMPRRTIAKVKSLRSDYVTSTIPNEQYVEREAPARRHLKGNEANSLNFMPTPPNIPRGTQFGVPATVTQFLVHPGVVDFGNVTAGCTYRQPLSMTNVSVETGRFRVKQPANSNARVIFTPGPVVPGFSIKMEAELFAEEGGVIDDMIIIQTEGQIFKLPLVANISAGDAAEAYPRPDGVAVALPGGVRRVKTPALAAGKKAAKLREMVSAAPDDVAEGGLAEGAAPTIPDEIEHKKRDMSLSLEDLQAGK